MKSARRWAWGALLALHVVLAAPLAHAQGFFFDNEARKSILKLQADLLAVELALKERISAVDAAAKGSVAAAQQDSQARSEALALQSRQRLEESASRAREALDRLAATLAQRIDSVNGSLREDLSRQGAALVAQQGVLNENQAVLQGDMKEQARQQDEFNRAAAARFQGIDREAGVLKGNQAVLQADMRDLARKQEEFNVAAVARLSDLDNGVSSLKAGRIEVSRAIDQLREDVQKWLAPLQASLDQLTRDLTVAQRTLRDHATLIADSRRKAEEDLRKLDERIKEFDEALRDDRVQWQKALAEQDARRDQKLAEAVRAADQRTQEAEERLRRSADELARRSDERMARLEQALRQAQERADKAEILIAQADTRLAEADRRAAEADKRLADLDRRLAEAESQQAQTDSRLAEADSRRAAADERAREAEERLVRLDEGLRRLDERLTQSEAQLDARLARIDERAQRMEVRWRLVDEQARQRGSELDLSPLGQRVGLLEDRLRKLEPVKVALDGIEFAASADEKRLYDEAIGLMGKTEFDRAAQLLGQFLRRYPASGYTGWVRFWQGHALAGSREHRGAISAFRALANEFPNHPKAAEAMLAMAASQIEIKDRAGARKTLEDLLRLYPDSDASKLGRQRLVTMR